jgi:RNA polymerase sigma-70 factor (ECF subfamily)
METSQISADLGDTALESDAAPNDAEEAQLILAAKAGDHRAFEDLLATYESRIYRCGLRMMGTADAAADILQEVALKMYRHLGQFEARARFATWLMTIAINQCRMTLRNSKKERRVESLDAPSESEDSTVYPEFPDWHPNPEQLYAKAEVETILNEALQQLTPSYREVFLLCDAEEFSMQEAAQILDVTLAAVKSRLHRARLQLRQILEQHFARDATQVKL